MPFSIHQFSRGINLKNEGGEWVSGGFGAEIANESYPVPEEIKQAVNTRTKGGLRMFGIHEAYPPQPATIALIARDLGNYCVLAVANRLKDDTGTREFVGYRYFWLDKTQFLNHPTPKNVDGIGTLLWYWQQKGQPQYNIEELQNNRSSYTTSWDNLAQSWLFEHWQQQHYQKIQQLLSDIRQSQQPLIYEATKDMELTWQEVHCLAIKYGQVNRRYINWAWNVRKLENTQGLNVIYCADAEALRGFKNQFPPVTAPPPAPPQTPTSSGGGLVHIPGGNTTGNQSQVKECLKKFRGSFEVEDILNLMGFYENHKQDIGNYRDKNYLRDNFSTEQDLSDQHIKYATLIAALTRDAKIYEQLIKLKRQHREVARDFLNNLLKKIFDSNLCLNQSNYNDFYGALSLLRDELSKSLAPNSSIFDPYLNLLPDQIRRFLTPILIILLLGGTVGVIYWQKPEILSGFLSKLPLQSHNKTSPNDGTGGGTVASSGGSGFLGELLDKYDRQYQMFQLGEQNKPEIEKNKTLEEIKTGLEDYRKKILQQLNDNQKLLLENLKNDNSTTVQNARKEGIYTDFKKLTTFAEKTAGNHGLPNLSTNSNKDDKISLMELQKSLERGGFYKQNTAGQQDYELGDFDESTTNAVKNAQKAYNTNKSGDQKIVEDDIVGQKTWAVLIGRIQDLQVEAVYQTLQTHLTQDNPTSNIVTEIKKCRDKHNKEKTPLHFNDCLENIGTPTTLGNEGADSGQ